jgi:hypothetical protein
VNNVQTFNAQILEFAKKLAPDEARTMQRKMALEGLRRLVSKTPVDTGRARANWQVGINQEPATPLHPASEPFQGPHVAGERPLSATPALSQVGQETFDAGAAVIEAMPLCTCYLTNNVEYIEDLERGHSGQAPHGMLAVTVEELKGMFP